MRIISFLALSASAMALSACMPTVSYSGFTSGTAGSAPLKVVASLDCPAVEGGLTRTARAADGRSCDYEGWGGETVHLTLVALNGRTPLEAMAPTKAELHTLVPVATPRIAAIDENEPGEHARVDLPFFHVNTVGDRADVRIFGIKIHSDGDDADITTKHGTTHTVVHASKQGAEVVAEDVGRTNTSMVYVLASDRRFSSGYHAVGYVAKGPVAGPLVVGEFRTVRRDESEHIKGGHYHGDHGDHGDLDRLINRNVKG